MQQRRDADGGQREGLRYVDWRKLPSTVMPSAPPSSRAWSLIAEPTPCFAAGRASVMAVVRGVKFW